MEYLMELWEGPLKSWASETAGIRTRKRPGFSSCCLHLLPLSVGTLHPMVLITGEWLTLSHWCLLRNPMGDRSFHVRYPPLPFPNPSSWKQSLPLLKENYYFFVTAVTFSHVCKNTFIQFAIHKLITEAKH